MDLNSLRCFEAAATTLNFRAAAARVHLSPAAFSDRLRRLEEDLGTQVFGRTTRKVELTEAGHRILPLARELLSRAESLHMAALGSTIPTRYELVPARYELGLLVVPRPTVARTQPRLWVIHITTATVPTYCCGSGGDLMQLCRACA
jgi:hypothetical protein